MRETAEDRRESDAVTNARNRIAVLASTTGTNHPEYATGLNQLALLLIMQGDTQSAEPLLRQALKIRRELLGENHPDYATNLSSLGGLLWARGALDQAEPLLRQAAEVRVETLGMSHPKSVVSLKSLEQLLKAKCDGFGSGPLGQVRNRPPSGPPEPEDKLVQEGPALEPAEPPVGSTEAGEVAGADQIAAGLERLTHEFAELGNHLARLGEGLRSGVAPAVDDLETRWSGARDGYARLSRDAAGAARARSLAPPADGFRSLADVAALMPALVEAEAARDKSLAVRREAFAVLDQLDRLGCPSDPTFAPLADCLEAARTLRLTIEQARPGEMPEVVGLLTTGRHPLNTLLNLVASDETTGDGQWADWFDVLVESFGNPLAVAAARSRIVSNGS